MAEEEEGDGEELTTPQPVWGKLILEVCPPIGLHEGRLICTAITERRYPWQKQLQHQPLWRATHSHKVEQREHSNAKVPPVLLITTFIIAEEVVAHDGKEEHEDEQEEEKVEYRAAESVQQCGHQNLQSPDEGDGTKCPQGTDSWRDGPRVLTMNFNG